MSRRAAKITATTVSLLTVAALIAFATPAVSAVWDAVKPSPETAAVQSTEATDVPASDTAAAEDSEADAAAVIAAARAEDPHPTDMNHPSRWAGACTQNSMMTGSGSLRGAQTLVDMGPSQFANGTVTLDDEGRIATYTVAPGDAAAAIGERFCVDYVTVFQYNDIYPTFSVHPDDVLALLPAN
ncbi:hypothetical protein [Microbacterium sp.]|uniref:hypothetical protein n=1 Tax=Microbacterium sp. TaxID=51671 RepID=UPI003F948CF8